MSARQQVDLGDGGHAGQIAQRTPHCGQVGPVRHPHQGGIDQMGTERRPGAHQRGGHVDRAAEHLVDHPGHHGRLALAQRLQLQGIPDAYAERPGQVVADPDRILAGEGALPGHRAQLHEVARLQAERQRVQRPRRAA
jgi:hypothetical protein